MSDFDLMTIYFILAESMGIWLWVLAGLAVVLGIGVIAGIMRLRTAGRPAKRPVTAALIAGGLVTAIFFFLVPAWTSTNASALAAPIDYIFAVLFALVPGSIVGALIFFLAANRCEAKHRTMLETA